MSDELNSNGNPGNPAERPLIADMVNNQPVAARVPEHVASGCFSTGSIVTTGANEFVMDFVLRMGKPHRLAARVVVPPAVAAQFASMLEKGIASYEQHFGPAQPTPAPLKSPSPSNTSLPGNTSPMANEIVTGPGMPLPQEPPSAPMPESPPAGHSPHGQAPAPESPAGEQSPPVSITSETPGPQQSAPTPPVQNRPGSLRDTYEELKVEDTVVSGTYANAVMISHTDTVFQFDFITNFLPFSAVSQRIFLPVSQAPRLLEALKLTLRRYAQVQQQMRQQNQQRNQSQDPLA